MFETALAAYGIPTGTWPPATPNYTETQAIMYGSLAYGLYLSTDNTSLPALSATGGSFNITKVGDGVYRAVMVAMDLADANTYLGYAGMY